MSTHQKPRRAHDVSSASVRPEDVLFTDKGSRQEGNMSSDGEECTVTFDVIPHEKNLYPGKTCIFFRKRPLCDQLWLCIFKDALNSSFMSIDFDVEGDLHLWGNCDA